MKRVALLALALLAALSAFACASESAPIRIETEAGEQALATVAAAPSAPQGDGLAPLSIVRGVQSFGEGYIVYPKVLYCAYAQQINDSMLALAADRAQQVSAAIFTKYRIEYNRNSLFSLRMEFYDLYEGEESARLETIYMTYDVQTGQLCALRDLFDQEDERWRGVMPDIITAQAEARGITLLCDVMPITDGQQFFLTEGEVVLVYQLYEIATYAAGEPEFALPISQLGEFIPEDSPLARAIAEQGAPAKTRGVENTPEPVPALLMADAAGVAEDSLAALAEEAPAEEAALATATSEPHSAGRAGEADAP